MIFAARFVELSVRHCWFFGERGVMQILSGRGMGSI